MTNTNDTLMYTLIWTCSSCGYIREGGQPKNECSTCAAYKTGFISFPQHLEKALREEFPELPPNHKDCRARRLELMIEHKVKENSPLAGRILPGISGSSMEN